MRFIVFLFVGVILFCFYCLVYYPIGVLLCRIGFRKVGLRLIAMSFFPKRTSKYCAFDCSVYDCKNWTCPKYTKKVGDK